MLKQAGNVLFIILIATFLFAALSYAITQSSRGSTTLTKENSKLKATEVLNFYERVKGVVTRARSARGCQLSQINFENSYQVHPDIPGGSTNSTAPSNEACDVFGKYGTDYLDEFPFEFTTRVSVDGIGTDSTELLMWFVARNPSSNDISLCSAINDLLELDGTFDAGTTRTLDWYYANGAGLTFTSSPAATQQIGEDGGTAFSGQYAGCLQGESSHDGDARIFYFVLEAI